MRNGVIGSVGAAALLAATLGLAAQSRPAAADHESMTYDQFMHDLTSEDRYKIFVGELSPEKRASLMVTHYTRCLAALGSTLTPEQTAIIHDAQEALTADVYRNPPDTAAMQKLQAVEMRAQAAFSEELGLQFFTMEDECKKK